MWPYCSQASIFCLCNASKYLPQWVTCHRIWQFLGFDSRADLCALQKITLVHAVSEKSWKYVNFWIVYKMCNLLKNKRTSFQRYRPIHCKSRGKGKPMSMRPFQIFLQPFSIVCMFISVWAQCKIESSYSPRKQKSHSLILKAHSEFMSRLLSYLQWIQVLLFIILYVWDWLRFFSFHGVITTIWLNMFVLQYPVRPADITYDNIPHIGARIKPDQQKVREKVE